MTKYPLSDHYDGKHFFNEDKTVFLNNSLINVLKWRLGEKKTSWPKFISDTFQPNLPTQVATNQAAITFINHATLLVQFTELSILTDPVFSKRVSPLSWIGPKRIRAPGIAIHDLSNIDVVTISHNHYDHLDLASLKKLHHLYQPIFIVPLGNKYLLRSIGIVNVIELDWWQSVTIKNCKITLTPAQHWSARGLHDRCKSLWGGFIYNYYPCQIYFAGDTGYNQHFKKIYEKFGAMNVSLLPIGAYEPRWFMKTQHMNPAEAVQAHLDLQSELSIGMHFGTFALTNEGHNDPVIALQENLNHRHISQDDFITLQHGETKIISI